MTKYDILNILYSERHRIKDMSNKSGWSMWAIIGSISICIWFLVDLLLNNRINWIYTILIAFFLFNILLAFSSIVLINPKKKIKNRYKSFNDALSKESITQAIFIYIILCAELIFLIINYQLWGKIRWLFYIAGIGLSLFLLAMRLALIVYCIKPPSQKKQDKKVTKIICLIYAILWIGIIVVFILPVIGNGIIKLEIKTGILISVISILFVHLPFTSNLNPVVSRIDDLIDYVLFERDIVEEKIFKELEIIELGYKLPEYMQKTLLILQFYSQLLLNRVNELNKLEKQLSSPSKLEEKIKLAKIMEKKASESLSIGKKSINTHKDILKIISSYIEDPLFSELLQKTKYFSNELMDNIDLSLSKIDNIHNTLDDFMAKIKLLTEGKLIDGETKCEFCKKYSINWNNID